MICSARALPITLLNYKNKRRRVIDIIFRHVKNTFSSYFGGFLNERKFSIAIPLSFSNEVQT